MHRQCGRVSRIVWVTLILAAFLAVRAAQSFRAFSQQEDRLSAFAPHIEEYLVLASLPESGGPPQVRGKLVPINVERREVDRWTYPLLPDTLRALRPEDVGTVALIRWDWQHVGTYVEKNTNRETGEAFTGLAELALIDLKERKLITRATFQGALPASGLTREGDFHSERPMFALVKYLEQLPRQ